jgi:hypothetical protein
MQVSEEPKDEPQEEERTERKKCKQCRQRHSVPTPLCPGGPY